jgi:DNA-binding transcriptional MerR regulator
MLIGELSQKTGLSRDTIRFYEKQRIISVGRKERRENNYKEYSEDALDRLQVAKRLKGFGFTLNEISAILKMMEEQDATCETISTQMQTKIDLIDTKIQELEDTKAMLLRGLRNCGPCCPADETDANCGLLTKDIPDTTVKQLSLDANQENDEG